MHRNHACFVNIAPRNLQQVKRNISKFLASKTKQRLSRSYPVHSLEKPRCAWARGPESFWKKYPKAQKIGIAMGMGITIVIAIAIGFIFLISEKDFVNNIHLYKNLYIDMRFLTKIWNLLNTFSVRFSFYYFHIKLCYARSFWIV